MEDIPLQVRRKKLTEVRQKLSHQTPKEPFSLSAKVSTGETISDFVTTVVLHLHTKRLNSKKSPNGML